MLYKIKFLIVLTLLITVLPACTPTQVQRGNLLTVEQVGEIAPGVHTRTEVLRLLGSPSTVAAFNDKVWYYIGQETEKRGILDAEVIENRIYTVMFDDEGTVTYAGEVEAEMVDVPLSEDTTPTHGNEITIMQQLIGNLGRFNPQSATNQ